MRNFIIEGLLQNQSVYGKKNTKKSTYSNQTGQLRLNKLQYKHLHKLANK